MNQADLASTLLRHDIDITSLALALRREDGCIYQVTAPRESAIEQWHRLRALVQETGYWPVVGWGARWLVSNGEYLRHLQRGSTADILAESERIDLDQWRAKQERELTSWMTEDGEAYEDERGEPLPWADVHGEWPASVAPNTEFYSPESPEQFATGDTAPLIPIALVPATEGWQVPAVLRFDMGFATPAVHAAMLRRWQTSYGAELVCMLPDLLELRVARPPAWREAALALAAEQYVYCYDIVIQGTQTVEALAASLLGGTVWFFWWD